MTQTIWVPAPDIEAQTWLLKDGTVVTTPPFERTATNKRIRVAGTTKSMGTRQYSTLVDAAIKAIATQRGSEPWVRVFSAEKIQADAMSTGGLGDFNETFSSALSLHLLRPNEDNYMASRDHSTAWWRFKAKGLPLYAWVFVDLRNNYNNINVMTKVVWRSTQPDPDAETVETTPAFAQYENERWTRTLTNMSYYSPTTRAVDNWLAGAVPWPNVDSDERPEVISRRHGTSIRNAVHGMSVSCERVNNLEEIQLPDLRDPDNPDWLTYELEQTNYSASFATELRDYVQTGPIMERIKERYEGLLNDLQLLGVVLKERPEATAYQRAVDGDFEGLAVEINPHIDAQDVDHLHSVYLNFATGTIYVACQDHSATQDAKAQWEIDKFTLEATGQMSEFLAYARAFHERISRKQAKKVSEARKFDPTVE